MYCFIIFLHSISSSLFTKSLLIPYEYFSIKSIDWILLSSFELKAISLISSIKTLCFSPLNLADFLISICFYEFFMIFPKTIHIIFIFSKKFILLSSWDASKLLLKFLNLSFLFMTHFFVPFAFWFSLWTFIKKTISFCT